MYVVDVKPLGEVLDGQGGRTIPSMGNDVIILLIIVLIIVVVLRGPKTIPQIGRMFGQGVREAREEINKVRADDDTPGDDAAKSP